MLSYYKNQEFTLEKIDEPVANCWINAVNPTPDEKKFLVSLGIPLDYITYALDADERSRVEEEDDGTLLIVIRVPHYLGDEESVPYITIPLGIIIIDKFIVTISATESEVISIFERGQAAKISTTKRNRFALRILMRATVSFLDVAREMSKTLDDLESKLYASMRNTELLALLQYQKCYVYFAQALKQNELALYRLSKYEKIRRFDEDVELLEDILVENTQAIDMTNISSSILANLMDAYASVISNNLNVVMKFLASVTIIMSIPNIISGFFGMNVNFTDLIEYGAHTPAVLAGVTVLVMAISVAFFYWKDWF